MTHRKLIEDLLAVIASPYKWGAGLDASKAAVIARANAYLAAPEQSEPDFIYEGYERGPELLSSLEGVADGTGLYLRPAPKAPEPVNRMLMDALKELRGAVHEIHHAHTNHRWFTNGEQAAIQHRNLWIRRAYEMVTGKVSAAITAAEQAPQPAELTDAEILAANHPDGVENGETISCPDYELIAFGRQVLAAQGAKTK